MYEYSLGTWFVSGILVCVWIPCIKEKMMMMMIMMMIIIIIIIITPNSCKALLHNIEQISIL